VYSIGEPTDEEQLAVEFINRARANPVAEADRLAATTDPDVRNAIEQFSVDLALMRSQFATLEVAAPLSIHPALTDAARRHSQDMFQNGFQGHTGTDGSSSGDRVRAAGYDWIRVGENVYAHALSPWHAHAGFNIDWGNGPGGMQTPPGHRLSIHNTGFREIGVGVVLGTKGPVGPQLVTHELASRASLSPFITGVAYYDLNGNQFYDLGEGLGGVRVVVDGATAEARTARSGGYSVPVPANGPYEVRFQLPGLPDVVTNVTVAGDANVKVDFTPAYAPPVILSPGVAFVGHSNRFAFSPVPGATAYEGRITPRQPWSTPEGAESGLGRFTAAVSPGYDPVATDIRQAGRAGYRMAHPQPPVSQYLTLGNPVRLGAAPVLSFGSRLGTATPDQVARVQVSTDGGASWADVWSQPGSGTQGGEVTFSQKRVPLTAFAGRVISLRFAYTFVSGRFFGQTSPGVGWYFDEVRVENSEWVAGSTVVAATGTQFSFRPETEGGYLLDVRPVLGDRVYPWGPALEVTARQGTPTPASIRIVGFRRVGEGWELQFRIESGSAPAPQVEEARSAAGPWTPLAVTPVENAGVYRAVLPVSGDAARFFRVGG